MKKFFVYLIIILVGAAGVYFALCKYNKKDEKQPKKEKEQAVEKVEEEKVPSKDEFVTEATKLQMLAEDINGANTCKCYNVKDIDKNTKLNGSILVYTSGDIYLSSMWLSNGYYYIENSEVISAGLLDESSEKASIYCGEDNINTPSRLCDIN